MKIGIFDPLFASQPIEEMLDFVAEAGCGAVEISCGRYPNNAHIDLDALLADDGKVRDYKALFTARGLEISALSCHGNPLHPNKEQARASDAIYRKTVALAQKLELQTVVCFSGCPGDSEGSKYPNWVTCPWPTDFLDILEWQWNTVAIPYWKEAGQYAEGRNVRVAFEMHPGFLCYNPETMRRMSDAVGPVIGANVDPSHLFWQGIDPCQAVRYLKGIVYYVHAKDTALHPYNIATNGVLDTKSYRDVANRAWVFRSVGYGHDLLFWRQFVSALREVGFDGVLSIEHEDALASSKEGFLKAVGTLKDAIFEESPGEMWWA
jgi:sugar phosphate isomerase/epimerase